MEITIKWNVCRVCLQDTSAKAADLMMSLQDEKIRKQIFECTGVEMNSDDTLPNNICRTCLSLLNHAVNFRTTCRNSNFYLQSVLQKTKLATSLFQKDTRRGKTLEMLSMVSEEIDDKRIATQNDACSTPKKSLAGSQFESDEIEKDQSTTFRLNKSKDETVEMRTPKKRKHRIEPSKSETTAELSIFKNENYIINEPEEEIKQNYNMTEEYNTTIKVLESGDEIDDTASMKISGDDESGIYYILNDEPIKLKYIEDQVHEKKDEREDDVDANTLDKYNYDDDDDDEYADAYHAKEENISSQLDAVEYLVEDELGIKCTRVFKPTSTASSNSVDIKQLSRKKTNAGTIFVCEVCANNFTNRTLLNYHMRMHRNEMKYQCEICLKRFNAACNLTAHMRIHTGEKPYECQYCGRRFADRSTHVKHVRIHTNEKPFSCTICNKSFSLSTSLRAHEKIHSGEKPYKCVTCSKSFKLAHQLKAHLATKQHKVRLIKLV